jgi:hypothetical protein
MNSGHPFRWGWASTSPNPSPSTPERPPWLQADWLDAERALMEAGPGGDVDANERLARAGLSYVPGLKRTVSMWLRLYEWVQRGELGGPLDGQSHLFRQTNAGGVDADVNTPASVRWFTTRTGAHHVAP